MIPTSGSNALKLKFLVFSLTSEVRQKKRDFVLIYFPEIRFIQRARNVFLSIFVGRQEETEF